jgi:putative ABC transport system permease protein
MKRRGHLDGLEQDLRDHIEEETRDNIERGMPPEEARYAAIRKFGNALRVAEDTREVWSAVWLEQLLGDVRYGLRMLRRNPGFTIVAVLTLALGIGVNTAVFSVINTAILRPLPYPDAERLVVYSDGMSPSKAENFKPGIAGADFQEWRGQAKSFEGMAGYNYRDATLATPNDAGQMRVVSFAGDFWTMTGARPMLGRLFDQREPLGAIVLAHRFFERRFGSDPHVVGKAMTLDGQPVSIVGVLPPDFQFLFPHGRPGMAPGDIDGYIAAPPLVREPVAQRTRLFVIGKLKPLVPIESAIAELRLIESRILQAYPDRWFAGVQRIDLAPAKQKLIGDVRLALTILQAAGIFVLLIACVNIANLLLARAAARRREIAIRTAIGAGAARVLRQFLAEGLVLAILGAAAGVALAQGAIAMMLRIGPLAVPRLTETVIDGRVLAFTLCISLGTGFLFGLAPSISLGKTSLQDSLRDRAGESFGWGGFRIRRWLVALELALAIVLLTGAGLMVKSFWHMYAYPPGFAPNNTLVLRAALSGPNYADKAPQIAYLDELVRRIESIPGVQAAGVADTQLYLLQSANSAVPPIVDQFQESLVSTGYFNAMGMRLIKGRWIAATDQPDATIINETMARRVFGSDDPIGKRIDRLGRPIQVVGVVANLKYSKLDAEPGPELYRAYRQNLRPGRPAFTVAIRMPGDPLGIAPVARKLVGGVDPSQPVYGIESLEQMLTASIAPRRFNLFLLASFSAAALLMAIVGIYGVIAYSVTQRTREIGIRMALGARGREVVRMVVVQGMSMALAGIAIGLAAAFALTRLMATLLYGVKPDDPFTFAMVAVMLAVTALLASWAPALRAALVDPLVALRHE